MSTRELPEAVRAANQEAAQRCLAEAPPPADWQIQILAPLFTPKTRRRREVA